REILSDPRRSSTLTLSWRTASVWVCVASMFCSRWAADHRNPSYNLLENRAIHFAGGAQIYIMFASCGLLGNARRGCGERIRGSAAGDAFVIDETQEREVARGLRDRQVQHGKYHRSPAKLAAPEIRKILG